MKKIILLLIAAFTSLAYIGKAQTHLVPVAGNTLLSGTNFTLKDPGGNTSFPANCSGSVSICPATQGQQVRISFTTLNLGGGSIHVYNGLNPSGNAIAVITSANQNTGISVISTDIMGCLTLQFSSSTSNLTGGFTGTVDEVTPYPTPGLSTTINITNTAPYFNGQTLNALLNVTNQNGHGPLFNLNVSMVLSTDNIVDGGDSVLALQGFNSFQITQPGLTSSIPLLVQLPTHIAGGNYYIIVISDYSVSGQLSGHPYTEVYPITITQGNKDIAVSNFTAPSYGDTMAIGYGTFGNIKLINNGNVSLSNTGVCIYLSTDSIPDVSDFALDTFTVSLTALQSTISYYNTNKVPNSYTPGYYYLIAKGDFNNQLTETNEQNNIAVLKVWLMNPYFDLGVKLTNTLPDTLYGDNTFNTN